MAFSYNGTTFTLNMLVVMSFMMEHNGPVFPYLVAKAKNVDHPSTVKALSKLESLGWAVSWELPADQVKHNNSRKRWELTSIGRVNSERIIDMFMRDLDWKGLLSNKNTNKTEEGSLPKWFIVHK